MEKKNIFVIILCGAVYGHVRQPMKKAHICDNIMFTDVSDPGLWYIT